MKSKLLILAALLFAWERAGAEPYLAAWKGVNCNACHANQTGGWLRNDFGKNYGSTLQTFDWQGISEAAQKIQHNTPSWVNIGMDIHQGYITTHNYNPSANNSAFTSFTQPLSRQDFSFQVKANEVVSGVFTYRLDENTTKEAYGLVSGLPEGGYVKFGNFMLPYGLNLSDDNSLIRRPLGFMFDSTPIGGVEAGIYPGNFFVNVAMTNGDPGPISFPGGVIVRNEKMFSAKAGVSFSDFTLGGSLLGANLDEPGGDNASVLSSGTTFMYNGFGWGRIGPVVLLAEYDRGSVEQSQVVGIAQDTLTAYHVSAEVDLGNDIYLRLTHEKFDDSLKQNTFDGLREVVSVRFYPMRNLKTQIDLQRMDPTDDFSRPDFALLADAFVFY